MCIVSSDEHHFAVLIIFQIMMVRRRKRSAYKLCESDQEHYYLLDINAHFLQWLDVHRVTEALLTSINAVDKKVFLIMYESTGVLKKLKAFRSIILFKSIPLARTTMINY